jgi:cell division protein ZapA
MGALRIDVLGTVFSIDARADEVYLKVLLENYKKMVALVEQNAGSTLSDPLQVAIMSGLMLCDELYKEKKRGEKTRQQSDPRDLAEAERLTLQRIEKIDRAID